MINSGALQSPQQLQAMSFLAIDIYAKLVFSILKVANCAPILFSPSFGLGTFSFLVIGLFVGTGIKQTLPSF